MECEFFWKLIKHLFSNISNFEQIVQFKKYLPSFKECMLMLLKSNLVVIFVVYR